VSLPAISLTILRRFDCAQSIIASLRETLVGRVLLLPAELSAAEREEIADLLALFLDLPVHIAARPSDAPRDRLCLIMDPVDHEPERVALSMLLGVRRRVSGKRRLDLPADLSLLKDVIVECIGRHHSGTRLQSVASWAGQIADSPSLALRFASAVIGRHISDPEAPDTVLFAAGLASTVGWLLRGIDIRVAHWVLARALPSKYPELLVSTEAAILGEDAALLRAFEAGLVEGLTEEPDDILDLRRPLHLLGHLDEAPLEVDFAVVARELHACLIPELYGVVERFLSSAPKRLGLVGPDRPRIFVGRADVLKRLSVLLEPANEVRTTVLYGVDGSGRRPVASALCELFAPTLEPIWITFLGGPEAGWIPVANALGLDLRELSYGIEPERVPRWVRRIHDLLRRRPCLLVVTDVDAIPEEELPGWLPSGPGECAVLVLSKSAQRALQRERDAIAVVLPPLALAQARELLANKAPGCAEAIEQGEADGLLRKLDGNVRALVTAGSLLASMSLADVEALVVGGEASIRGIVQSAIEALDPEETRLAQALAVCAPAGSPRELPLKISGANEAALERLGDKALVVTTRGRVRLHGLARLEVERELGVEERRRLEEAHARTAQELFQQADEQHDQDTEEELHDDALFALMRLTEHCRAGDGSNVDLLALLAEDLREYPRGNHAEHLEQVIAGCRAALGVSVNNVNPQAGARAQNALGIALVDLPTGDQTENLREAIEAYRAALTVLTREDHPRPWATIHNNLGNALRLLPTGDHVENLRLAIESFRASLTVWTRETYPENWAGTQCNLGIALAAILTGDREENSRQALELIRVAAEVMTREADPHGWALSQRFLGSILTRLPTGDRAENLRQAVDAYQAALTIHTLEAFPRDWASTKSHLGWALANLPTGDRPQNLRDAVDANRAALTVFTEDAFPHDHASVQRNLDDALQALDALEPPSKRA
jgi:tetratricopeptide (TPR) repeat protein